MSTANAALTSSDAAIGDAPLSAAQRRRSLIAVIASLTVQSLIFGLSMPLLALVLDAQGVAKTLHGLSAAAMGVDRVLGAGTGGWWARRWVGRGGATRPAIAWGAAASTVRLMRLSPTMSTIELIITTSLSPTNARTSPEASVLSMTFGTPKGRARMAAVPMVVPAEPPMDSTPSISPWA